MKRHTEGPWEARTFLLKGGKRMSDTICHVGASTSLGPPRAYETEANARLIAAAPELLEALEWMVENDETNEGEGWEEINSYWIDGLNKARAAIKKEKGE